MPSPSRRRPYSQTSIGSRTTQSYFNTGEKYYCYCGTEAAVLEMDDNYQRYFMACPREVTFFIDTNLCTPPLCIFNFCYANPICLLSYSLVVFCKMKMHAPRDAIDELVAEVHQVCDMVRVEQNDLHFIQDEDRAMDMKVQMELRIWKGRFTSSILLNG
ncbi:hypothetical protein Cgig2_023317 [Carnegiea gigantea]|uniref:Uncharacterized protein n=1 Tax=Carnegiea gigantea TaxID=171969 RepID=A0A9Q1JK99_9CARY|nr:hypothetical protein Cgig2_023317 [Carnegiea gigantea]